MMEFEVNDDLRSRDKHLQRNNRGDQQQFQVYRKLDYVPK